MTRFVLGSTPVSRFLSGVVIHTAPSPYVAPAEFGGTSTSATILLLAGSMRDKTPLASVTIHTASGLAAMPPSLCEGAAAMVAVTSFVLMSTRETTFSPQLGTQMLPKPAARPEHGRRPTVMAASTLFVLGSSRWI